MKTLSGNEVQKGHEGALLWTLLGIAVIADVIYTATHFDQHGKDVLTLFALIGGIPLSLMFVWWLFKRTLILFFRVAPLLLFGFFVGAGFWIALHIL
jgi:hypothetical protein